MSECDLALKNPADTNPSPSKPSPNWMNSCKQPLIGIQQDCRRCLPYSTLDPFSYRLELDIRIRVLLGAASAGPASMRLVPARALGLSIKQDGWTVAVELYQRFRRLSLTLKPRR